ncbi:hypothetical protein SUGI_1510390 [Cryptomeria japonica]|uniref:Uncharacterized protein n=1 Tax=Cryptomeria japonica TaxID=3369 RepID=A0AAD3RQ26_CRYJA|nr:hypothetical protein SUGI_1466970 [Cryptomeria japonica]GLJ59060.1 hypothetical protein SUGI_1490500 [Cryptomeria japonica]GLJ59070.1 hypothetical protein SUGI_1491260 [Cryptomeria japonica]GLJ59257.1 hypothetical protein SUGI_1499920 [Cryptomeria japonica]GLJ59347.1 hypothetical protein SUGI_1504160 [Cryptomeria japonica]
MGEKEIVSPLSRTFSGYSAGWIVGMLQAHVDSRHRVWGWVGGLRYEKSIGGFALGSPTLPYRLLLLRERMGKARTDLSIPLSTTCLTDV